MYAQAFLINVFIAELDFSIQNEEALTPLHVACIKGNMSIVNLIFRYTSSDLKKQILSTKGNDSKTPLQLAMFYGHEDVSLVVLKESKELESGNQPYDEESSTLHDAAKYNLVVVIEYLLERYNVTTCIYSFTLFSTVHVLYCCILRTYCPIYIVRPVFNEVFKPSPAVSNL